jgi:hypothetical protein
MNMRDLELLESVEQKFLRGDAEYIAHLRALHDELTVIKQELHKLVTLFPGRNGKPEDDWIINHPEAQKSDWEGI